MATYVHCGLGMSYAQNDQMPPTDCPSVTLIVILRIIGVFIIAFHHDKVIIRVHTQFI